MPDVPRCSRCLVTGEPLYPGYYRGLACYGCYMLESGGHPPAGAEVEGDSEWAARLRAAFGPGPEPDPYDLLPERLTKYPWRRPGR